ncbi:hypothetical protein EDB19DRAFT_2042261 [Suillus lakei]|nr:hypothetical protein EDB19DRAFT_2042261 [Suillus lakei]
MISTTFYVASRIAITGFISVAFFDETILRPIRSGPRKISAGLVVSAFKSTIILILAADEAASIYLSNNTSPSASSTGEDGSDIVPAAPKLLKPTYCLACQLQGTPGRRPPASLALLVPAQNVSLPFQPSSSSSSPVFQSTTLDLSNLSYCKRLSTTSNTTLLACEDDHLKEVCLPFQPYLSSPVLPCDITTTLDLPNLANCNRLSISSDTTLIACDYNDDILEDIVADEVSDTKDVKSSGKEQTFHEDNYTTPHPGVQAPAHVMHDHHVDVLIPPSTTINITSPFCPPNLRPLFLLVDKFRTTPTLTITRYSLPGSAHLMDALLQTTKIANSLHSSPSVASNDDFVHLEDVFTDNVLDTKNVECHIDTLPPSTPILTINNTLAIDIALPTDNTFAIGHVPSHLLDLRLFALIDNALAINNTLAIDDVPSYPLNLRSLALVHNFLILSSPNTNPSGSHHPTDVFAQKTKATASWLKPLILVTKHAARRLAPPPPTALQYQPEKLRPHKLKQHKRKPRVSRINAACDGIVRSRLRRHANRTVDHLAQVCEQIRTDQVGLMDSWVAAMAEVGLTSMLAGNHRTSPGLSLVPTADTVLVLEPGSRMKARLASLRHRTNAVAAAIPPPPSTFTTPAMHFLTPLTSYATPHGFITNYYAKHLPPNNDPTIAHHGHGRREDDHAITTIS